MVEEIRLFELAAGMFALPAIETLYFGGGTPSLLEDADLEALMNALNQKFAISPSAEITLEANPDDLTIEKLALWKSWGINRLSIGIQSFFEQDLHWMNRAHNAKQAKDCILLAQNAGFSNLSIDLIYGTPGLTQERWEANVKTALELGVPHLSCYALTVEEKTPLDYFIRKGKVPPIDEAIQAEQFEQLCGWMNKAGYIHYEISNFALPGMESRHNSNYWSGEPYFGFGPSAHSFNGLNTRWWNIANNALYISAIKEGVHKIEKEELTPVQRLNEQIMTGIRTHTGIAWDSRQEKVAGVKISSGNWHSLSARVQHWKDNGSLEEKENHLVLTEKGKFFVDGIAADLFLMEGKPI